MDESDTSMLLPNMEAGQHTPNVMYVILAGF